MTLLFLFANNGAPSGLPRGGSGRGHGHGRRLTVAQASEYWDRYDALRRRAERLKDEEQRAAAEASAEAVAVTLEASDDQGQQFDLMMAAVDRAIAAKTAAKVVAEAKRAEEAALAILIEDENSAVLLLLS